MGFSMQWIKWIMLCIETVDYSVLVNGNASGSIIPRREGLSALINRAEARGDIHGVKICKNAPIVSHLLFADDCFLFFRANAIESLVMKNLLVTYEKASGQAINLKKSEIFCSRNVSQSVHNNIASILGVKALLGTDKYLGLPSMIGRSKKATFNFIKDRVRKKINSWSSKSLSKSGREVLIKYVLQSIPTYFMSHFTLPPSLCDEIEKMMNVFWWGRCAGAKNKGIRWLSWDKLSMHKKDGGMSFKNLGTFNLAMLGKQGWRIMTNPESIIARMYKARYYPRCNFLEAKLGDKPSYVWRSICNSKFILKADNRWSIGDGATIPLWGTHWIGDGTSIIPQKGGTFSLVDLRVSDCIYHDHKEWNIPFLNSIFDQQIVTKIINTPLYNFVQKDQIVWRKKDTGEYYMHSAYRLCMHELLNNDHFKVYGPWELIWRLKVPPKVKKFLWRLCRNCVPTRSRLREKGINCTTNCVLCDAIEEDIIHLFFQCPSSSNVWSMSSDYAAVMHIANQRTHISRIIFQLLQTLSADSATIATCILWSIWRQRNNKLWEEKIDTHVVVLERAKSILSDWKLARIVREGTTLLHDSESINTWLPPTSGRFKCNIDASFSKQQNKVGIGMYIRDSTGAFVLAKTEWFSPICEVHIGEALGLLSALHWVHELNLGPTDFELDSKRVVDRFRSPKTDVTEFGAIIQECKNLFQRHYENSSVKFVRRQANETAHNLAKVVTLSTSFQVLVDVPSCIEHIFSNEMN